MSDLTFSLQQSLRYISYTVLYIYMGLNDVYGYRALEIERGDLLDTYRTCLQEKRKADSDLNAMRYHVHSH
jgi:hypothetical protein